MVDDGLQVRKNVVGALKIPQAASQFFFPRSSPHHFTVLLSQNCLTLREKSVPSLLLQISAAPRVFYLYFEGNRMTLRVLARGKKGAIS